MWKLGIIICGIRAICHDGGHSVWLDHGFAKLDVPFGYRLGYTIGMSTLEVPIWGA